MGEHEDPHSYSTNEQTTYQGTHLYNPHYVDPNGLSIFFYLAVLEYHHNNLLYHQRILQNDLNKKGPVLTEPIIHKVSELVCRSSRVISEQFDLLWER
jgi:hypothetical protein